MAARPGDRCWQSGDGAPTRQFRYTDERTPSNVLVQSHAELINIRQLGNLIELDALRDAQPV